MGRHGSKISRIEHGTAVPSANDIRAWCHCCRADGQADDLIAALRAVETMWQQWRRMERTGLRQAQADRVPVYEQTRQFRCYASHLLPGLLQTQAYTTTILEAIMRRREVPDDITDAVSVRMQRQSVLHDPRKRFAFLIEESLLRNGIGGPDLMAPQLAHLITMAALPNVSVAIVPDNASRETAWLVEPFWIFDSEQVSSELISGFLTITQPNEIAMYEQVFAELSAVALTGSAARHLITKAIDGLG